MSNNIETVSVEHELKESYLDYAMSVIVGRALPDSRDGFKPVHRRVLYAMHVLGNDNTKGYKKSARVVGDVIGKYHPHGDSAVYDTIVRMAQPFSLRYPLVDGQGNFGSIDGDSAAAMRYTEVKMEKITKEILDDLNLDTVDFKPNYDGTELIPTVMPTKLPNLLINGSSGIAVGMATNIPPHNCTDVLNACIGYLHNPDITIDELMEHIPGPDFPTGGEIRGLSGIRDAYTTGRGKVYVRARVEIEEIRGHDVINVTELPYMVNKARLIESIAQLVKENRIDGISAIRDESDKDGMSIIIECKRGIRGVVLLNKLYAMTKLQNTFGINLVALDDQEPKLFDLKGLIKSFVNHRREVVTRRALHELREIRKKVITQVGLSVALANIDKVIKTIQSSKGSAEAKERLVEMEWAGSDIVPIVYRALKTEAPMVNGKYKLSPEQATTILGLQLYSLTSMEQEKLSDGIHKLLDRAKILDKIIVCPKTLTATIEEELVETRETYKDERRTILSHLPHSFDDAELIENRDMVVTLSHDGYVKTQELEEYNVQHRNGRGKSSAKMKDEDYVEYLTLGNSHDDILCFSNLGRVYKLKVYDLPVASRGAKGKPIVNILPLMPEEIITTLLPTKNLNDENFVIMATANGVIKKVSSSNFSKVRVTGIIAIDLQPSDVLVGADICNNEDDIMIFSENGKVVRFDGSSVRAMGRSAGGVRGIKLLKDDKVVSLIIPGDDDILTVTEYGYGKRTPIAEYPKKGRATQGVISINVNERNGKVIGSISTGVTDEFMVVTSSGSLVRINSSEVSQVNRNTLGVGIIKLDKSDRAISIGSVPTIPDTLVE